MCVSYASRKCFTVIGLWPVGWCDRCLWPAHTMQQLLDRFVFRIGPTTVAFVKSTGDNCLWCAHTMQQSSFRRLCVQQTTKIAWCVPGFINVRGRDRQRHSFNFSSKAAFHLAYPDEQWALRDMTNSGLLNCVVIIFYPGFPTLHCYIARNSCVVRKTPTCCAQYYFPPKHQHLWIWFKLFHKRALPVRVTILGGICGLTVSLVGDCFWYFDNNTDSYVNKVHVNREDGNWWYWLRGRK